MIYSKCPSYFDGARFFNMVFSRYFFFHVLFSETFKIEIIFIYSHEYKHMPSQPDPKFTGAKTSI